MGTNVSTNFITAPADPKETLGIKLPFLVMIIKNVNIKLIKLAEKILHFWGTSFGWQKCEKKI